MPPQKLKSYKDVQALFNDFVAAQQIDIGDAIHSDFWNTLAYEDFVNGEVPNVPGVKILESGASADSNLIRILKGKLKVGQRTYPQMPEGGPYMSPEMIASLADWIDSHCPQGS